MHADAAALKVATGVHPALVHAVTVCGFILTEDNWRSFDPADVDRWEQAIDAYLDAHPDAPPL